jgi:ABC-type sugar transport system substrate-binding protein
MEECIRDCSGAAPAVGKRRLGRPKRSGVALIISISVFLLFAADPGYGEELLRSPDQLDAAQATAFATHAQELIATATRETPPWNGPESGPGAPPGKVIAFVTEDLRNGGIIAVAQGARQAAVAMRWTLKVFDADGTSAGRAKAMADALAAKPDGIVICGSDAIENNPALTAFSRRGIPVVGWHAGAQPGPIPGTPVAMNVTSLPIKAAQLAAMAAVAQSGGRAGVVILTDSRYSIAMAKAKAMEDIIRACKGCTLLEVRDVAISQASEQMPAIARQLLLQHGERWTHALAINDIYFDYAIAALTNAGVPADKLSLISAGDGSASAFLRIQAKTYQTATVAEPLNLQGWQVMDELNRLIAGQPVSGFVMSTHLVNANNAGLEGGDSFQYDPDNGYRDRYRALWKH